MTSEIPDRVPEEWADCCGHWRSVTCGGPFCLCCATLRGGNVVIKGRSDELVLKLRQLSIMALGINPHQHTEHEILTVMVNTWLELDDVLSRGELLPGEWAAAQMDPPTI